MWPPGCLWVRRAKWAWIPNKLRSGLPRVPSVKSSIYKYNNDLCNTVCHLKAMLRVGCFGARVTGQMEASGHAQPANADPRRGANATYDPKDLVSPGCMAPGAFGWRLGAAMHRKTYQHFGQ